MIPWEQETGLQSVAVVVGEQFLIYNRERVVAVQLGAVES